MREGEHVGKRGTEEYGATKFTPEKESIEEASLNFLEESGKTVTIIFKINTQQSSKPSNSVLSYKDERDQDTVTACLRKMTHWSEFHLKQTNKATGFWKWKFNAISNTEAQAAVSDQEVFQGTR